MRECACMRVCVHACVRACVHMCVCVCVCARARVCDALLVLRNFAFSVLVLTPPHTHRPDPHSPHKEKQKYRTNSLILSLITAVCTTSLDTRDTGDYATHVPRLPVESLGGPASLQFLAGKCKTPLQVLAGK